MKCKTREGVAQRCKDPPRTFENDVTRENHDGGLPRFRARSLRYKVNLGARREVGVEENAGIRAALQRLTNPRTGKDGGAIKTKAGD